MSAYPPPPPGYTYNQPGQPVPTGYGPPGGYSSNVVVVTQPGAGMTARPGACRHCGIGHPETSYSILGILIALIFFPLGVLCCLMMTETRCSHCKAGL